MIRKWEYFLKDALSYKPLDRKAIKTRDLILHDGHSYDEFKDPFRQIAHHLWHDIQNYELGSGRAVNEFSILNAEIPRLN